MRLRVTVSKGPNKGKALVLDGRDSILIGSSAEARLCLSDDALIAPYHAVIEFVPPTVVLRDLAQQGGVFVSDIANSIVAAELNHGSHVTLGNSEIAIELIDEEVSATADTMLADLASILQSPTSSEAAIAPQVAEPVVPLVSMRCCACGEKTDQKVLASEVSGAACFCEECRKDLQDHPPLLPDYKIVRELGRGGMGVVYLAEHPTYGPRVLKILLPENAVREYNRKLFVREAKKQAGLIHPNIVELYDFVEPSPGVFVAVMEYVRGYSCEELLTRSNGKLRANLAVHIICEALKGLGFVHKMGLVHRDIKEANVLVSMDNNDWPLVVKIADFGLAKSYQDAGATVLTKPGQIGGTAPYMPPEQIRQFTNVLPPADIYAMGATLYRLLTGTYPHDVPPGCHAFFVIMSEPIVPLTKRLQGIPPKLSDIVEKAMAKAPEDRYQSAEQMREELLLVSPLLPQN